MKDNKTVKDYQDKKRDSIILGMSQKQATSMLHGISGTVQYIEKNYKTWTRRLFKWNKELHEELIL